MWVTVFCLAIALTGNTARSDSGNQPEPKATHYQFGGFTYHRGELVWTAAEGRFVNDKFEPVAEREYRLNLDEGTMTVNGEKRSFSRYEGKLVQRQANVLFQYVIESTTWWNDGSGKPATGTATAEAP